MKQYSISLLGAFIFFSVCCFGQDPLAPAVGVVEDSAQDIVSISEYLCYAAMAVGMGLSVYFFVQGNIRGGLSCVGGTVLVGSILLALLN